MPTLLLRGYLATGRDDLGDALGVALAQALVRADADTTALGRAAWLTLFVEASIIADDERLLPAAAALSAALQASWPTLTRIAERVGAGRGVSARRRRSFPATSLVPRAIDELEHAVGASYRPGDGLRRAASRAAGRGSAEDHVRAASALLTAFELTGRLPYSMLAEELIAAIAPRRRRRSSPRSPVRSRACCAASPICMTMRATAARR